MLSDSQRAELEHWSRNHPRPGMRLKALAVGAVARGFTRAQAGGILNVSPYTVGQWYQRYVRSGWAALQIRPGRGRRSGVDAPQVQGFVRQSPRNFGIQRTRWTLKLLGQTVPCLAGLQPSAVWHALRRLGISYKRAEPWLHSPDADYAKKNVTSRVSSKKREPRRKP